jgi:hypothetical protein
VQSLCCLNGARHRLTIALPERFPGGLTQDIGASSEQHQRGEFTMAMDGVAG